MSHIDNKVDWCLKKAEKELAESDKHRGLIKISIDSALAQSHIVKAEHNLKAITEFKRIGYSDWSASATFYSIYHCFLAILAKHGYESRNQECTFALIRQLIGQKQINLDMTLVDQVNILEPDAAHEASTVVGVRELEQYGIKLSLEDDKYNTLLGLAKNILDKTKEILQS